MGKADVVKEWASDLVGRGRTTNPSRSHRGHGDGMLAEEINATRETPAVTARGRQRDARESQARPSGVAERLVVVMKPGNSGGAKGPQFKDNVRSSAEREIGDEPTNARINTKTAGGVACESGLPRDLRALD